MPTMPELPGVLCYHAAIPIKKGDEVLVLRRDLPDFALDEEVLEGLARDLERKGGERARTVGELVEQMGYDGVAPLDPSEVCQVENISLSWDSPI